MLARTFHNRILMDEDMMLGLGIDLIQDLDLTLLNPEEVPGSAEFG